MELIRHTLPWEDIGKSTTKITSAAEAIKVAELDFEVSSRRLLTEDHVVVPKFAATVRTDTGGVLGVTSTNYKIVQNQDAFLFADSLAAEHGLTYENAGTLYGGRQIWLTCKLPQQKLLDDDLDLYLVLFNSHDGKGSIRICLTPIRVVCANMQNAVIRNNYANFSIYHSSLVSDRLAEANQTLQNYITYVNQLNKLADRIAVKKMDDDTFINTFNKLYIKDSLKQVRVRNLNDIRDTIIEATRVDDLANYTGTAWGYLQAVLDVAQHRVPKRQSETYKERLFITQTAGKTDLNDLIDALVL